MADDGAGIRSRRNAPVHAAKPQGGGFGARMACKPDSVPRGCPRMDGHSSGITVAGDLVLPTRGPRVQASRRANADGPPIWHCSRWGLPCRFCCQSRGGLLLHRFTFSPTDRGSLFSVALSLGLPPPGITRHRAFLWSPDFPPPRHPCRRAGAAIQPSARGRGYAPAAARSTTNRRPRSVAIAISTGSRGPSTPARNRRRKARSRRSSSRSGP